MQKYKCTVCDYIYDPEENNGVPFEGLPPAWVCPDCDAGKDVFVPV